MSKRSRKGGESVFHHHLKADIIFGSIVVSLLGTAGLFLILFYGFAVFLIGLVFSFVISKKMTGEIVLARQGSSNRIDLSPYHFFVNTTNKLYSRDFGIFTIISIPKEWRQRIKTDTALFQCRLAHEIGHSIENHSLNVHSWLISALSLNALVLALLIHIWADADVALSTKFFLVVVQACALHVLRQTPSLFKVMEFRADDHARALVGADFEDFLSKQALAEKFTVVQRGRFPLLDYISRIFHPPFSARRSALKEQVAEQPRLLARNFYDGISSIILLGLPFFLFSEFRLGEAGYLLGAAYAYVVSQLISGFSLSVVSIFFRGNINLPSYFFGSIVGLCLFLPLATVAFGEEIGWFRALKYAVLMYGTFYIGATFGLFMRRDPEIRESNLQIYEILAVTLCTTISLFLLLVLFWDVFGGWTLVLFIWSLLETAVTVFFISGMKQEDETGRVLLSFAQGMTGPQKSLLTSILNKRMFKPAFKFVVMLLMKKNGVTPSFARMDLRQVEAK